MCIQCGSNDVSLVTFAFLICCRFRVFVVFTMKVVPRLRRISRRHVKFRRQKKKQKTEDMTTHTKKKHTKTRNGTNACAIVCIIHFSHQKCLVFFIENLRKVTVLKTVQGLGLSVTGGVASSTIGTAGFSSPSTLDAAFVACSWPGLIRIKKIFPHGAAWQTGQLAVGDVLLAANGQPLTGCTNYVSLYLFLATNFFFPSYFYMASF